MIKGLDVKDPFKANRETSFPREDYTPYVTYVDCREKVVLRAVQVRPGMTSRLQACKWVGDRVD